MLLYNSHNLKSVICLLIVCSVWPIDKTLSGATVPNRPGRNGNERVLHISQISKSGALPSDCLMLYQRLLFGVGVGVLPLCQDVVDVFYSSNRLVLKKRCPMYELHLIVIFYFWRSGKSGVSLHCHYSQVHSSLER